MADSKLPPDLEEKREQTAGQRAAFLARMPDPVALSVRIENLNRLSTEAWIAEAVPHMLKSEKRLGRIVAKQGHEDDLNRAVVGVSGLQLLIDNLRRLQDRVRWFHNDIWSHIRPGMPEMVDELPNLPDMLHTYRVTAKWWTPAIGNVWAWVSAWETELRSKQP